MFIFFLAKAYVRRSTPLTHNICSIAKLYFSSHLTLYIVCLIRMQPALYMWSQNTNQIVI